MKPRNDRSHEDWLRFADYSCSGSDYINPPSVSNSKFHMKVAILDGMPHLYVEYICNDGYLLKVDKKFMYCNKKKWYGHIPLCVSQ